MRSVLRVGSILHHIVIEIAEFHICWRTGITLTGERVCYVLIIKHMTILAGTILRVLTENLPIRRPDVLFPVRAFEPFLIRAIDFRVGILAVMTGGTKLALAKNGITCPFEKIV